MSLDVNVVVVDNMSAGSLSNLENCKRPPKVLQFDISGNDASKFKEVGKVGFIFHLAALSLLHSFKDPAENARVNIGGTINVLEYARAIDAKVVFASTGSVYGNPLELPIKESHPCKPISPYAASKLSAEEYISMYVRTYGLVAGALRYFNVFGPRQRIGEETGVIPIFVDNALKGKPLKIFGSGKQTRDFLHVSDAVKATILAAANLEHTRGEAMNVGGMGREVSIIDLARIVGRVLNKKIAIIHDDPKPGDIPRLVADSSKAAKLIGFSARVTLEDGLEDYVHWHKSRVKGSL